jgi:hypothetical protein
MAGLSRRFSEAGYLVPKYMLQAHGHSLFALSLKSFEKYFHEISFLFIVRDILGTVDFVHAEVKKMGIDNYEVVVLTDPTAGQAETVSLGIAKAGLCLLEPITIFNIDTFRPYFEFPLEFNLTKIDGYLEVFRGQGDNWSYVKPDPIRKNHVIETAEKVQISDLCCTGLYHFGSVSLFNEAYALYLSDEILYKKNKEHFIAPIYNKLIEKSCNIYFHLINRQQVIFCGVPSEYVDFIENKIFANTVPDILSNKKIDI